MIKKLAFALILGLSSIFISKSQVSNTAEKGENFITLRPLSYISGINIGYERSITKKFAISTELTSQIWGIAYRLPNTAIYQGFRYTPFGDNNHGVYVKGVLVAGLFSGSPIIENRPYFAGGGFTIGALTNIQSRQRELSRFSIYIEAGLKFAYPFGTKEGSKFEMKKERALFYSFYSNASLFDLSIGLRYRL